MKNSLRVVSLVGCAVAGAVLAYSFGTNQFLMQLETKAKQSLTSAHQVSDGLLSDVTGTPGRPSLNERDDAWKQQRLTPEASFGSEPFFAVPAETNPVQFTPQQPQPRVAAEDGQNFSQVPYEYPETTASRYELPNDDQATGFVVPEQPHLLPANDAQFTKALPLPTHLLMQNGDTVTPTNTTTGHAAEVTRCITQHEVQAIRAPDKTGLPGKREAETTGRASNFDSDSESIASPYVVLSPGDARPLLTLRLGRSESRQLTALEMVSEPSMPVTPAQPVARNDGARARLFVEVDDQDLTCSIHAQHVELRELLTTLGQRAGLWIAVTQHVEGLVSTDITGTRLEVAVEQIVSPLGYSVGVRDGALLIGEHDEVLGYDRRLPSFAAYEQRKSRTQSTAAVPTDQVQLVSYPDSDVRSASVATAIPSFVPDRASVSNAIYVQPTDEIPMHAGPNGDHPPSSAAVRDARRAKIASEDDNIVSIIAERALNLMRDGHYRRTVNMLSQLVTEHDRSAQLFQLLGEAYYHCGQFEAAEISLKHSLQLYKNDARANYFMGCTLHTMGDRQRSLHYLLQAHDLDPMYPPIVSEQALTAR